MDKTFDEVREEMTDRAKWAKARGNMYKFLAGAFLEPPNKAFIAPFLANDFIEEMEDIFGAAAVADLHQFVGGFKGDYESLDQEFQDLFMVPLGRYTTPYEAVYRDERDVDGEPVQGLLMGSSTLAVRELYRDAGAVVSEDFKDLPDHVGLELACMEFLCEAEARAWEQKDLDTARRTRDVQIRLLHEHLLLWAPALCVRIRENAAGPFYRGIASLTEAYLKQEGDALGS